MRGRVSAAVAVTTTLAAQTSSLPACSCSSSTFCVAVTLRVAAGCGARRWARCVARSVRASEYFRLLGVRKNLMCVDKQSLHALSLWGKESQHEADGESEDSVRWLSPLPPCACCFRLENHSHSTRIKRNSSTAIATNAKEITTVLRGSSKKIITTTEAAKIAAKKVISQFFFVCSLKVMSTILVRNARGTQSFQTKQISHHNLRLL